MLAQNHRAALTMVGASVFIALATFLAKGIAGRFELSEHGLHPLQITAAKFSFAWLLWVVVLAVTTQNAVGTLGVCISSDRSLAG